MFHVLKLAEVSQKIVFFIAIFFARRLGLMGSLRDLAALIQNIISPISRSKVSYPRISHFIVKYISLSPL